MVRKTHRGIALLLVIALSFPLLETNAWAASSYTKEALFLQFPQYLINEETQNRADEMIQSGIDVLEAQSTVDEIAAHLFHFVESGLSFSVREIASEFGNEILNDKDQYCLDIAMSTLSRTASKTDVILFCQITAERRETDPLFQGNIQVLRLNDCEGNSCAELYKTNCKARPNGRVTAQDQSLHVACGGQRTESPFG